WPEVVCNVVDPLAAVVAKVRRRAVGGEAQGPTTRSTVAALEVDIGHRDGARNLFGGIWTGGRRDMAGDRLTGRSGHRSGGMHRADGSHGSQQQAHSGMAKHLGRSEEHTSELQSR